MCKDLATCIMVQIPIRQHICTASNCGGVDTTEAKVKWFSDGLIGHIIIVELYRSFLKVKTPLRLHRLRGCAPGIVYIHLPVSLCALANALFAHHHHRVCNEFCHGLETIMLATCTTCPVCVVDAQREIGRLN